MKFKHVVDTREKLRSILREPSAVVTRKTIQHLDEHCEAFISRSPFVLLASSDQKGNVDVSPKGDPPGFVKILDRHTLAIPDRLGNNRADSMENILQNPKVGLIFLIPGKSETLRVSGTAIIVHDTDLLESMAIRGRAPALALVITVQEAFFHCSKCMIRSSLWDKSQWPGLDGLPTLAQTMVDGGKLDMTTEELHEGVVDDEKTRLY